MPRLILLHSPLLGPQSWRPTAAELARRGRSMLTPRLPPLLEVTGGFYADLAAAAAAAITADGEEPAILALHSAAGELAPSIAAALGAALAGVIFVDAILPHPGRSWLDTAPAALREQLTAGAQQGLLPAWDGWWPPGALEKLAPDADLRAALIAELEPLPLAYFEEVAPEITFDAPCAYLQLSGAYEEEGRRAVRLGWPVVRLPATHLAPATQPRAVATALETLTDRLCERADA